MKKDFIFLNQTRITALLVDAPRPMAPGQDHHRHGETEPVGLKVVQTPLR